MAHNAVNGRDYTSIAVCAADISLRNAMGILPSVDYNINNLSEAFSAPRAILRNRDILARIWGHRITYVLVRARIPRLPRANYRALVSTLSLARCDESQLIPLELEDCRRVLVRFRLYERLPSHDWLPIIRRLIGMNVDTHVAFSRYSFADADRVDVELADASLIMITRQSSRFAYAKESESDHSAPFRQNASLVSQAFRVENIDGPRPARTRYSRIDSLELGTSLGDTLPVSKMLKIANSGDLPGGNSSVYPCDRRT